MKNADSWTPLRDLNLLGLRNSRSYNTESWDSLFSFRVFFDHKSILILPLITYMYTHLWKIVHETITFTTGNAFSIYGLFC